MLLLIFQSRAIRAWRMRTVPGVPKLNGSGIPAEAEPIHPLALVGGRPGTAGMPGKCIVWLRSCC